MGARTWGLDLGRQARRPLPRVVIDSRLVKPGDCFFAIKGDRLDGHDFLEAAMERGAAVGVCSRTPNLDAGAYEDRIFLRVADTTLALISERAFDFVNFTGSVKGGRAIERAAAGTFTSLGLELGGKDPGYVMEDADLAAAVSTLMDGAMYNSGQCCCGIERIYVHAASYDAFVDGAVEFAEAYRLGSPLDEETTLGPMAHRRFADEARAQVAQAVQAGPTAPVRTCPGHDGGP